MRIVLSGPPSVGKTTQGRRLAELLSVPHVSSGALIRNGAAHGDERAIRLAGIVGDGSLAPSAEIVSIVLDRLSMPDCAQGFVLDGFPRKAEEAKALLAFDAFRPDAFVVLSASASVLMQRVRDRNLQSSFLRADDDPEVFPRRLEIYAVETAMVRAVMVASGVPVESVDAEGGRDAVWGNLMQRFQPDQELEATLQMAM